MFRDQPQCVRTAQKKSVMNLSDKLLYYNRFSIRQVNCFYFTSESKLAATLIVRNRTDSRNKWSWGTRQMSRDRWPFLTNPCCFLYTCLFWVLERSTLICLMPNTSTPVYSLTLPDMRSPVIVKNRYGILTVLHVLSYNWIREVVFGMPALCYVRIHVFSPASVWTVGRILSIFGT
jgi:hypothetical protein